MQGFLGGYEQSKLLAYHSRANLSYVVDIPLEVAGAAYRGILKIYTKNCSGYTS